MDPRGFYRPTAIPDSEIKHYCPRPRTRMFYAALLVGCIGFFLWLFRGMAWRADWLLLLIAVSIVIGLIYALTVRVVIDARTITRSWLAGRRVVVLESIEELGFDQGVKGGPSLVIRGTKKRSVNLLTLSSDIFELQDIRCMHRDILLALGLDDDEPMWREGPLGYLDVQQVLRYKHFKEDAAKRASAASAEDQHLTYPPPSQTPRASRD
ncbi:MAG: hypothetical protein KGK04_16215 [Xanthomonadaceae bacterium]|nr:hypothetical protein [Xanthomonadaceae bacterium]